MVTGDFFMVPEDGMKKVEKSLKGLTLERKVIMGKIAETIRKEGIQSPGMEPKDLADAIMKIKGYVSKYPAGTYPFTEA